MKCVCLFLFVFIFKCSMSSQITSFSTFVFIIFGCDYGIVLFKEPTVEKKPVPEVPKPTVAPVEQKIVSPHKGI